MRRALVLIVAGAVLFGAVVWLNERSQTPEAAYERLGRDEIEVNTAFKLEDLEPVGSAGDRIGTIYASYQGPDELDELEIHVFTSQGAAEDSWEQHLQDAQGVITSPSTRQPRYEEQVCTLDGATIRCAARMYEAIVVGMAAGGEGEDVKANAQMLLMAGVKNWLAARGLGLPDEQEA